MMPANNFDILTSDIFSFDEVAVLTLKQPFFHIMGLILPQISLSGRGAINSIS